MKKVKQTVQKRKKSAYEDTVITKCRRSTKLMSCNSCCLDFKRSTCIAISVNGLAKTHTVSWAQQTTKI